MKVTIVQAQSWLGTLEYDVTFATNNADATLTIAASNFSFTPSTTGDLTATVSGDDIDGGSDTVEIISTSEPPITISYDMPAYTFAENSTDTAVYLVATLDAAYPREPSRDYAVTFSTTSGTAEDPEDYVTLSGRDSFTRSEYGRDADTDPFVARKLLSDFGFALVDDAIYEGSERFGLTIEPDHHSRDRYGGVSKARRHHVRTICGLSEPSVRIRGDHHGRGGSAGAVAVGRPVVDCRGG